MNINRAFPYVKKPKNNYFIAEIGSNHNQDEIRLINLIYEAKNIGCDGVKLQYFNPETLWAEGFVNQREQARQRSLPFRLLQVAFEICIQEDISLGCSVFDIDDVRMVSDYCNFLKIASYECMWNELIDECLATDLPLFISTGMCTPSDIFEVWDKIKEDKHNVLFHCMSMYPFKHNTLFRYFINMFGHQLPFDQAGYSDHTVDSARVKDAVSYGAKVIECHLDLEDKQGLEYSHGHCWTPKKLKECIKECKDIQPRNGIPSVNSCFDKIRRRIDKYDVMYRTDPIDGSRPLIKYREYLIKESAL